MLSTADADVERYLKLFTLLPLDAITTTMQGQNRDPSARHAQHLLAHELVSLVHGAEAAAQARDQHAQVFGGGRSRSATTATGSAVVSRAETETESETKRAPLMSHLASLAHGAAYLRSHVVSQPFAHVLELAELVSSRGEGQRLLDAGGVYLGRETPSGGLAFQKTAGGRGLVVREEHLIGGRMLVLRLGKKHVKVIEVVEDEGREKGKGF